MQKAFINEKIIDGTKDMSVMSGKCIWIVISPDNSGVYTC